MKKQRIGHHIKFDGTLVITYNYSHELWNDYEAWIIENCKGRVCSGNCGTRGEDNRFWIFELVEEAMAFKLRWL